MTILRPTVEDLETERAELIAGRDMASILERAPHWLLTTEERRLVRRLEHIAFLLGEDHESPR